MKKRILSILLSLCMLLSLCPALGVTARAEEDPDGQTSAETTYAEVTFVSDGTTVATQMVENGKTAVLPEAPTKVGYAFAGWHLGSEEGEAVTAETTFAATQNYTVVAVFTELKTYTYTVKFYTMKNGNKVESIFEPCVYQFSSGEPVKQTIYFPTGVKYGDDLLYPKETSVTVDSSTLTGDVVTEIAYTSEKYTYTVHHMLWTSGTEYTTEHSTETFSGAAGSTVVPDAINIPGYTVSSKVTGRLNEDNQNFYVRYDPTLCTVRYESNGGSYVEPIMDVAYGTSVTVWSDASTAPTRAGYTFAGWYSDEALTTAAPGTIESITGDVTVYAKWTPSTANYTIAYFQELYNNDTKSTYYTCVESKTATATTGTTVTASGTSSKVTNSAYYQSPVYSSAEVAGDGSTVVTAVYNLKRYTFTFDLNDSSAVLTMNGVEYRDSEYQLTDVVLGQGIADRWPTASDITFGSSSEEFYYWKAVKNTNKTSLSTRLVIVTAEILKLASGSTITWTCYSNSSMVESYACYWIKNPSGDGYTLDLRYSQYVMVFKAAGLGQKEIEGYAIETSKESTNKTIDDPVSFTGYVYDFYYTRNQYSLTFQYGDTVVKTAQAYYDVSLTEYAPTEDEMAHFTIPEGYSFAGWYDSPSCQGEPYVLSEHRMPASAVTLYAKVTPNPVTVTEDYGTGNAEDNKILVGFYGDSLNDILTDAGAVQPTREGYRFRYWYTKDGDTTTKCDLSKPLTGDTTIYAMWQPVTGTYTVKYVDGSSKNIISPKVVYDAVQGQTVTEQPASIAGYVSDSTEAQFTFDLNTDNAVTFTYTQTDKDRTYTVKYVKENGENVADSVTRTVDAGTGYVTETAVGVDGYYPTKDEISQYLVSGENLITFVYKAYTMVDVKLNFYVDNDLKETKQTTFPVGQTVTQESCKEEQSAFAEKYVNCSLEKVEGSLGTTIETGEETPVVNYYFETSGTVQKLPAITNGAPEASKATNNGYITVSAEYAAENAEITVNAYPEDGCKLDKIEYTYNDGSEQKVDITSAKKFYMPAYAVTVTATFSKITTGTIDLDLEESDTYPDSTTIDQYYTKATASSTVYKNKILVEWSNDTMNIKVADAKKWNPVTLAWETDEAKNGVATVDGETNKVTCTLTNYSAKAFTCNLTFAEEESQKAKFASYAVDNENVTLAAVENNINQPGTSIANGVTPTTTITATITPKLEGDGSFAGAEATTSAVKYGTFTISCTAVNN